MWHAHQRAMARTHPAARKPRASPLNCVQTQCPAARARTHARVRTHTHTHTHLVVLVVVRDQVCQREAVVRRHKVDRGGRAAVAAPAAARVVGPPAARVRVRACVVLRWRCGAVWWVCDGAAGVFAAALLPAPHSTRAAPPPPPTTHPHTQTRPAHTRTSPSLPGGCWHRGWGCRTAPTQSCPPTAPRCL
jgi:hypothetical protein